MDEDKSVKSLNKPNNNKHKKKKKEKKEQERDELTAAELRYDVCVYISTTDLRARTIDQTMMKK